MEKQFPLDIPLWDFVVVFSVSVEIVPVLSFPSENLTLKQFIKWHINAAVTTKTTITLIIPPINGMIDVVCDTLILSALSTSEQSIRGVKSSSLFYSTVIFT